MERSPVVIYLDNAATSWPKPPGVAEAMVHFLEHVGASPGRSAHRLSIAAGRIVDSTREALAALLGVHDPLRIALGCNATEALNLALRGLLRQGDHVVTSSVEHNSVMRPLRALELEGVELTVVPCGPDGTLDSSLIEAALRPNTVMIALNHASNVIGTILPVSEVGRIARRHELLLLVDAAATAGAIPIDMEQDQIDLLAFTGHKSLHGPMGTGGLAIGERVDPSRLKPLKLGGTGSGSEKEEQPAFLPDLYESGTPNAVGLAGLLAGLQWLQETGVRAVREHHRSAAQHLIDGLRGIAGVTVYGTLDASRQVAPVAFNIDGMAPSEAGLHLDEEHDVLCRIGLHCAPAVHRTIGTFPDGTVRFAAGAFTTREDTDAALQAVAKLVRETK